MDAVIFLKERNRMCDYFNDCNECPLVQFLCRSITCYGEYADNIVPLIEKWSNEHPQKTML